MILPDLQLSPDYEVRYFLRQPQLQHVCQSPQFLLACYHCHEYPADCHLMLRELKFCGKPLLGVRYHANKENPWFCRTVGHYDDEKPGIVK